MRPYASGSGVTGPGAEEIAQIISTPIESEAYPGVTYTLEQVIGRGGFALACRALRQGPDAAFPVVIKVTRPSVVAQSGEMVSRALKKEVVALGRLNERVPPTPFVVRLIDTGSIPVRDGNAVLDVPWIALEYVHGGVEGETLSKRVRYSVEHTGFAFDPERAANVIRQLANGLAEIHAAQVIHRDLKPSNVLSCGFGHKEIVKISDFGIARPTGVASTFGKLALGTAGYVAPEQLHLRDEIGPWTDVFSMAGIVYFLLTGGKYFDIASPVEGVFAAMAETRKRLVDGKATVPELRDRSEACEAIDAALARATNADPRARYHSAPLFAAAVLPWLTSEANSSASRRLISSVMSTRDPRPRDPSKWQWNTVSAGGDLVMVDLAWNSDGHCLAAIQRGLTYWDGTAWTELSPAPLNPIHMVRRIGPGRWLLSTDHGKLHVFDGDEATEMLKCPDALSVVTALEGDLADLAVMIGSGANRVPTLAAYCGRRWLRPIEADFAASVPALAQLDGERWLLVGRKTSGGAFLAEFRPLDWKLEVIASSDAPALVTCASQPELVRAIAAGGREVIRVDADGVTRAKVDCKASLSACDLDLLGGEWVGAAGEIWFAPDQRTPFGRVWSGSEPAAPFVGVYADAGRVVAITADGGVLEGRVAG